MTALAAAGWWNLLDPRNPLSPLHPAHPMQRRQGARGAGPRRPPLVPLPEHDGAVSAQLYRNAGRLDALPAPNMEWWWNTIELDTHDGSRLFVLTNVHSFGTASRVPDTRGTVTVFDVRNGRRVAARSAGRVTGEASCKYEARGWFLQRLDPGCASYAADLRRAARLLAVGEGELARASRHGCYVIVIDTPALRARLYLEQRGTVLYGDHGGVPGWYDNNPGGAAPTWASYRSRFQVPHGQLELGASRHPVTVVSGHARFDHQSLHWSAEDNGPPSPAALLEQMTARPKWAWYHGRLEGGLNVMAYEIWNANTRVKSKVAASVANEHTGEVAAAHPSTIMLNVPRTHGALSAPVDAAICFDIRGGQRGVPSGRYEVRFGYDTTIDWTVDYAAGGPFVYRAQEAYCTLSGRTPVGPARGTGTQEVLDLGVVAPA